MYLTLSGPNAKYSATLIQNILLPGNIDAKKLLWFEQELLLRPLVTHFITHQISAFIVSALVTTAFRVD